MDSSSSYQGDDLDQLSCFLPSDTLRSSPEPSGSYQTLPSTGTPSLILSDSIPYTLQRVGDRRKPWVLYTEMTSAEFLNWWFDTQFGAADSEKKKIRWDGRGHHSDIWVHFEQVAHYITGEPKVMCKRCGRILDHPNHTSNGTNALRRHLKTESCRKGRQAAKQPSIQRLMEQAARDSPPVTSSFTEEAWQQEIINTITTLRLPFQTIEHPQFQKLLRLTQSAPSLPTFPCAKSVQRRMREIVKERQAYVLAKLPPKAKLSLALDCWTSPFQQAFMAVTGYFIDKDWNYREILLGFEPLHERHTGVNLGSVLFDLLQQHKIPERVMAITTDNASNNSKMMSSIQDSLQSLDVYHGATIIRIPCIAHVIQLSLKQLLGHMKANPKNETREMIWSEEQAQSARRKAQKRDIANTLRKIRDLAVFINASPQRRESFLNIQTEQPKLVPIQDVRTRWNSTFLMLRRAKRLQSAFDQFCAEYGHPDLQIDREEWRQIEYLLYITQPFFQFTTALSKTKDVTIHSVFSIYNKLFDHLELSIRQLRRKKVPWKQQMLEALESAETKLREYYTLTDNKDLGDIYAIGTILAPQHKLQFFSTPDWHDPDKDFTTQYRQSLESRLQDYKEGLTSSQSLLKTKKSVQLSELDILLTLDTERTQPGERDELREYLRGGTVSISPRQFWRDHQHEFPTLASLARDILSVPATGAGVERLFNSARDICHYRRGSLNATTIQDLMLFMCTTRFEVEEEQLAFIRELATEQELESVEEETDTRQPSENLDPISDNEEDESLFTSAKAFIEIRSQTSLGKRRRTDMNEGSGPEDRQVEASSENEDEDEDEVPLPSGSSMQQRVSGRVRVPSTRLQGYTS